MQNLLNDRQLLVGDLTVRFTDQVRNVDAASTQIHDVDRRTSGDLHGVHGHLTVGHVAALSGLALGLDVSLDAASAHIEHRLVIVTNVLDVSDAIQEIEFLLLELVHGESNGLSNLLPILSAAHIHGQLRNNLSGFLHVLGVDTLVVRLRSQHLDQLAVASNINVRHCLSPP